MTILLKSAADVRFQLPVCIMHNKERIVHLDLSYLEWLLIKSEKVGT